jgi:hypothetical protein
VSHPPPGISPLQRAKCLLISNLYHSASSERQWHGWGIGPPVNLALPRIWEKVDGLPTIRDKGWLVLATIKLIECSCLPAKRAIYGSCAIQGGCPVQHLHNLRLRVAPASHVTQAHEAAVRLMGIASMFEAATELPQTLMRNHHFSRNAAPDLSTVRSPGLAKEYHTFVAVLATVSACACGPYRPLSRCRDHQRQCRPGVVCCPAVQGRASRRSMLREGSLATGDLAAAPLVLSGTPVVTDHKLIGHPRPGRAADSQVQQDGQACHDAKQGVVLYRDEQLLVCGDREARHAGRAR